MKEILNNLIKESLKNKETEKVSAYRLLKAELIKNDKSTLPMEESKLLKAYVKQLRLSANAFHKNIPILDKINREIEIISLLLPKELDEETTRNRTLIYLNRLRAEYPEMGSGQLIGKILLEFSKDENVNAFIVADVVKNNYT